MAKYDNVIIASSERDLLRELKDEIRELDIFDNIRLAFDGRDAINIINDVDPDLIIVDYVMAGIDGLGVIEEVRKKFGSKKRVIVVSNISGRFLSGKALNCGADYICIRPYDKDIFFRRIKELMAFDMPSYTAPTPLTPELYAQILSDITIIVQKLGIPAGLKGYYYIRSAIMKCLEDRNYIGAMMSRLYPEIAKEFSTTVHCVERDMRHAIEVAFSRGDINYIDSTFGYTVDAFRGKPTNSAFIATIVDQIAIKYGLSK